MVIIQRIMAVSLRIELSLRVLEALVLPLHYKTIWYSILELHQASSRFLPRQGSALTAMLIGLEKIVTSGNCTPHWTLNGFILLLDDGNWGCRRPYAQIDPEHPLTFNVYHKVLPTLFKWRGFLRGRVLDLNQRPMSLLRHCSTNWATPSIKTDKELSYLRRF